MVYLVPKPGQKKLSGKSRDAINEGWKPEDYEALHVTEDFPDMYQEYLKAFRKAHGE
jgi:hypothetical protein